MVYDINWVPMHRLNQKLHLYVYKRLEEFCGKLFTFYGTIVEYETVAVGMTSRVIDNMHRIIFFERIYFHISEMTSEM